MGGVCTERQRVRARVARAPPSCKMIGSSISLNCSRAGASVGSLAELSLAISADLACKRVASISITCAKVGRERRDGEQGGGGRCLAGGTRGGVHASDGAAVRDSPWGEGGYGWRWRWRARAVRAAHRLVVAVIDGDLVGCALELHLDRLAITRLLQERHDIF